MKIKKATTRQFQASLMLTIPFYQKSQKLPSIVPNKSSPDIMLMQKLVVKSSMSVPSTTPANMISSVQMEQFFHKNSLFVFGGINLTATQLQVFSLTMLTCMRHPKPTSKVLRELKQEFQVVQLMIILQHQEQLMFHQVATTQQQVAQQLMQPHHLEDQPLAFHRLPMAFHRLLLQHQAIINLQAQQDLTTQQPQLQEALEITLHLNFLQLKDPIQAVLMCHQQVINHHKLIHPNQTHLIHHQQQRHHVTTCHHEEDKFSDIFTSLSSHFNTPTSTFVDNLPNPQSPSFLPFIQFI